MLHLLGETASGELIKHMHGLRHKKTGRSFQEECLDASSALAVQGFDLEHGYLLAVYPFVRRNPFLRMLYSADLGKGFASMGIEALEQLENVPIGLKLIVHYHWIHTLFAGAKNGRGARQAVTAFLEAVKRQKDAGRPIVWTVHNITSHEAKFLDEEILLRAEFAQLVDHIHIMNPETRALCSEHYDLPANRIFQVSHPSYHGVYGDYISKSQARLSLGLQPEEKVFLLFGGVGPSKGIRQFLEQLDALQSVTNGKAQVVIAGAATDPAYLEKLFQQVVGRLDVQFHLGHVDDQNVQSFFRAADVVVCAHPDGLNSGVANTAASFGCPVVLANNMAGTVLGIDNFIFRFDPTEMATCTKSCLAALDAAGQPERALLLENWAQATAPLKTSTHFFDQLRARL